MTAYRPVHGGFIRQNTEYVDRAFGFATGINFWFQVSTQAHCPRETGG